MLSMNTVQSDHIKVNTALHYLSIKQTSYHQTTQAGLTGWTLENTLRLLQVLQEGRSREVKVEAQTNQGARHL